MSDTRASYTSADAVPVKLLQDKEVLAAIREKGIIIPVHAQIIPTNKCNLKCQFCSCDKEDRDLEMDYTDILHIIGKLSMLGTKSITITGGGEPTLSPHLGTLVGLADCRNIKTGLVSNGIRLNDWGSDVLNKLTWCRISAADERRLNGSSTTTISRAVLNNPDVDWAFSYVVSSTPNLQNILDYLYLAEELKFSHVRLVADLMHPEEVPMAALEKALSQVVGRTSFPIIFQYRQQPEQGKNCRICYLKPVITPDKKVYACCGAQYALATPSQMFPEILCMGTFDEFVAKCQKPAQPFDNAKYCAKCYYGQYNRILDALFNEVCHREFV